MPLDWSDALTVAQGCPVASYDRALTELFERDYVPCTHDVWAEFADARRWTAADFAADHRIDISADTKDQWTIFRAPDALNNLLNRGALAMSLAPGNNHAFHAMLNASVEHIRIGSRPIAHDLLIPWLGLLAGSAYFPTIHWDTDWLQFPTAPGYQIWCMVHPHPRRLSKDTPPALMPGEGSIFLVTSSELGDTDPPVRFVWNEDGTMSKLRHTEDRPEYPLKGYARAVDANLTFHYMDLKPGECVLWSKRTLHMSDPRPHLRGGQNERVAAHLRVSARSQPHGPIDYWPNHPYALEAGSMPWNLKQQSTHMPLKGGYRQLVVDGDELIERNPSHLFGEHGRAGRRDTG